MEQAILKEEDKFLKEEFNVEEEVTYLFTKNYKRIISDNSYLIVAEKQVKSKKITVESYEALQEFFKYLDRLLAKYK